MLKGIGLIFTHVIAGLGHLWDQAMNKNVIPLLSNLLHAALGATAGLGYVVYQALETSIASGAPITIPSLVPVVVMAIIVSLVHAATQSPYQFLSQLASNVTPEQENNAAALIDTKVLAIAKSLNVAKSPIIAVPAPIVPVTK